MGMWAGHRICAKILLKKYKQNIRKKSVTKYTHLKVAGNGLSPFWAFLAFLQENFFIKKTYGIR